MSLNITDKVIKYAFIGSLLYNICYDLDIMRMYRFNISIIPHSKYRAKYILNNGLIYGALLGFFSYYYEKPLFSKITKHTYISN